MRLYADTSGRIVRALRTADEAIFPTAPEEAVATLVIDEMTNAALVADFWDAQPRYALHGEVLTKDGVPVPINPSTPAPPAVDSAAIGAALASLPDDHPLTKADLAPLLALFGAGAGQPQGQRES
jgi:hypothetical protein